MSQGQKVGAEQVGAFLEHELADAAIVLHNLRVPGSRATIDHVVIASSGIWVVDSKWRCKLEPELDSLEATTVGEVGRHVDVVANAVGGRSTELPIRAALCFPSENWGGDPRAFCLEGVLVTYPSDLVERIRAAGPLDEDTVGLIGARLALGPAMQT